MGEVEHELTECDMKMFVQCRHLVMENSGATMMMASSSALHDSSSGALHDSSSGALHESSSSALHVTGAQTRQETTTVVIALMRAAETASHCFPVGLFVDPGLEMHRN